MANIGKTVPRAAKNRWRSGLGFTRRQGPARWVNSSDQTRPARDEGTATWLVSLGMHLNETVARERMLCVHEEEVLGTVGASRSGFRSQMGDCRCLVLQLGDVLCDALLPIEVEVMSLGD
jgi:hypothetical protein